MKLLSRLSCLGRAALPLVLAFTCLSMAGAKTYTFSDQNFRCDAPDEWPVSPPINGAYFYARGPAPDYPTILVTMLPDDPVIELHSPVCYNTIENNFRNHGLRVANRRLVMANGYQMLEINDFKVRADGSIENQSWRFISADGYLYSVTMFAVNADPTANPRLVAARDSFRFLTPPLIPRDRSLGYICFHPAHPDNLPDAQMSAFGYGEDWLLQILGLGTMYSPAFLVLWCGMLIAYFLTRPPRVAPIAAPIRPPVTSPVSPASSPEAGSPLPVNRAPAPSRKMGYLPAPRQLPPPPGPPTKS